MSAQAEADTHLFTHVHSLNCCFIPAMLSWKSIVHLNRIRLLLSCASAVSPLPLSVFLPPSFHFIHTVSTHWHTLFPRLFPCWQRWQLKPLPNWLAVKHHFVPVIQMSSPGSVYVRPSEIITSGPELFHVNSRMCIYQNRKILIIVLTFTVFHH